MSTIRVMLDNLWHVIRFTLDGQEFTRRLVPVIEDWMIEIGMDSPVGEVLIGAQVGDEIVVTAPGGALIVNVLEIA